MKRIAALGVIFGSFLSAPAFALNLEKCLSECRSGSDTSLYCDACEQAAAVLDGLVSAPRPIDCGSSGTIDFRNGKNVVRVNHSALALDTRNADVRRIYLPYSGPAGMEPMPVSVTIPGQFTSVDDESLEKHFSVSSEVRLSFSFMAPPQPRRAVLFNVHGETLTIQATQIKCLAWATDYTGPECVEESGRIRFNSCSFPRIVL